MAARGKSSKPGTGCSWKMIPPPRPACKIASTSPFVTRPEAAEAWDRGTKANASRDSSRTKRQQETRKSFIVRLLFFKLKLTKRKGQWTRANQTESPEKFRRVHLCCTCEYASLAHSPLAVRLSCLSFKSARRSSL